MFLRVSKIALLFFLFVSIQTFAQDDAEKQRIAYEEKVQEELFKRVNNFLTDLQVDDFQKEIIKQKLHSYFEARKKIYLDPSLKYYERDEKLKLLPETHFSDIENLIPEPAMQKIKSFANDGGEELKKEKKKKNRKKKNKKDE